MPVAKSYTSGGKGTAKGDRQYVPGLQQADARESAVVAVLCADIHLSHHPPVARAGEKNWFGAMRHALRQVSALAERYRCPVVCAGDVFDRHNPAPELINFAIVNLPVMYAVPGQHDLPFHNYEDLRKSAYWTLVEAGEIINLEPNNSAETVTGVRLHGFPFGCKPTRLENRCGLLIEVAVVHSYFWSKHTGYIGAPKANHYSNQLGHFREFDVVISGDNHIPFSRRMDDTLLFNCGSLMRRTADQANHRPSVGLLKSDGSVERHYLDMRGESFDATAHSDNHSSDFSALVAELEELGESGVDFPMAIRRALEGQPQEIKQAVLEAMES